MGVRGWLKERKKRLSSIKQQREGKTPNEPLGSNHRLNGSAERLQGPRIEDTPIRKLWNVAYEKLRGEDSALISEYETKLQGSVVAGLSQALDLKANTREWMQVILQSKMDEVNKNASKLRLGNFEVPMRDVVQLVLNIVDSANDYIKNAASVNPYTSIGWSGVSFILPLLMNPLAESVSLAKGLEYIASLIAQSLMREELYVECYESGTSDHERFWQSHRQYKIALEKLYRQILRFQATSCCYYSKNSAFRYGLDAVKWKDWDQLVDEVRERERNFAAIEEIWRDIQRHEERLAAERLQQATISSLAAINTKLSASSKAAEIATDGADDKEHDDLMCWLCDIDPSSMYNAARDSHEAGTCEWLVKDSKEFKTWETSDRSLLWLHGKAGSGKSILTSSVIKHFQDRCASELSTALAYFYFSFSDPKKQNVDGMLASLTKQIYSRQPPTSQFIQRLRGYKIKGERPDTETLESMLIASISGFANVYVVTDALDECPLLSEQRGKLLKSLHRILANSPTNLHILLTSRKEPDIDSKIRSVLSPPSRIEIDLLAHRWTLNKDIHHYINSQLSTHDYKSWPESVKQEARESLIEKADCMFQYVQLQLEALRSFSSVTKIRKALQGLPTGLDATYKRIFENIDPDFQEQVINSLKWLAFSKKILTIEELAEIFIISPHNDIIFDEAERLFSSADILKYFSGLIVTQEHNRCIEVRLVHFSLKEYLISSRIAGGPASVFSFTEVNAHLSIVQSCLAYLMHLSLFIASGGTTDVYDIKRSYPLAEYAARYWMAHLEEVPRVSWSAKIAQDAAGALAVHSQNLLTMFDLVNGYSTNDEYEYILKPYCYTARHGLCQLTEMLIYQESGANKYVTREELDVALQHAAYEGMTDVMQVLLKAGADVNAQCGKWGSALQAAAEGGRLNALELLVSCGVNLNSPSNKAGCVLACIPKSGTECLKFLLDSGVDINMQDETLGTALHVATVKEYRENFHLLLERGADVNALGGMFGTPLQAACTKWDMFSGENPPDVPQYVKRLLESGADPSIRGGHCSTPLHASCMEWDEDIDEPSDILRYVKRLLESGADPNIRGGRYGTALQAACSHLDERYGHGAMKIIQLLIENGADVTIQGGEYGTALHAAAASANPETIDLMKLLLDNGAKVDQPGCSDWGTVLHVACNGGNEETVRWLLDRGADVNAECGRFGTPLQAAVALSRRVGARTMEEMLLIVDLLINKGAQVNQTGGEYGTALQTACSNPDFDVDMLRFLLEHGADVNAKGGKYGTALAAAAHNRSPVDVYAVYLLLEHGADANAKGGQYETALLAGCTDTWNAHSVRLLVEHGADVNAEGEYGTALTAACECAVEESVRLLLEYGADVRHRDYAAWHAAVRSTSKFDFGNKSVNAFRLLLNHVVDIDINHVDEEYGTALNSMIETWYIEDIWSFGRNWQNRICLLLKHGADVDVKGGKYGFALETACAAEFRELYPTIDINYNSAKTKWLLQQCPDINVNAQGGVFGSALQAAAFSGQTESVKLLLGHRRKANVNARGGKYGSALNAAIVRGYWDIVEILLQEGATPDCHLQQQPDEEWLEGVREEHGRCAVARYMKFWEVQSGSEAGVGSIKQS